MALKVLVTGDIHIGKKSTSVNQSTNEMATKSTWLKIVDYAVDNKIDILALTGDIVDRDNRFFEAIGPLQSGFDKLKTAEINVFMVSGNHDFNVLSQLADTDKYDNIHLLGKNGTWEMKTFLKKGENDVSLQLLGWSFPQQHFNQDPLLSFDITGIQQNIPTIGLLHGDVGVPESSYAPINLDNFMRHPVNVWMLGHIHKPQILREKAPLVYYPGSPHALSPKEQGKHGPVLLTIHSPIHIETTPILLSPVRYERIEVDITDQITEESVKVMVTTQLYDDAESKEDELEKVSFLVYDLILTGQHSKIKELENWMKFIVSDYYQELASTKTQISVRKVSFNVKPKVENLEELALESSPAGILAQTIIALNQGTTTAFSDRLMEQWNLIRKNVEQAPVYEPLRTQKKSDIEEAKVYLLTECNRILSELIEQQNS